MTKESFRHPPIGKRVKDRAIDAVVRYGGFTTGMTQQGKEFFLGHVLKGIKDGKPVVLSEITEVLDGHNFGGENYQGLEYLDILSAPERGGLVVATHLSDDLILRGFVHQITTSHAIKERTGKEPCWVQGKDNPITGFIHKMVSEAVSTVHVPNGNATQDIKRRIEDREIVAITPEATMKSSVSRATPKFGGVVRKLVDKDVPIILAASWVDLKGYHVSFSKVEGFSIEEEIAAAARQLRFSGETDEGKKRMNRVVSDFVMWNLVQLIPHESVRGDYANYVPYSLKEGQLKQGEEQYLTPIKDRKIPVVSKN